MAPKAEVGSAVEANEDGTSEFGGIDMPLWIAPRAEVGSSIETDVSWMDCP